MVDIDLLDKINRTKVAAGPWSGWPLDKLQTPVRWIAGIISSSLASSASSPLSSSASYRDNFADRSSVGEVAENCKDDNAGEDRGERVAEANDECVPVENLHCGIGIVISGLLKFLQPVTIVGEVIVA